MTFKSYDEMSPEQRVAYLIGQSEVMPEFSPALLREMIQEEEEHIRGLDYMLTRHRTRLAWLRAIQRGTIKP